MADIAALKKEKEELIAKRDAIREENQSNFDYVAMIKQKSVLKTNVIVWVAVAAVVVMIGATLGLSLAKPDASPMLMWLTVGLPAVAAVAYTVVAFGLHEKYTAIYKELDRDLSGVRLQIFNLGRQIEKIDEELAQAAE